MNIKKNIIHIATIFSLLFFFCSSLFAQEKPPEKQFEINSISIKGTEKFSDSYVLKLMSTKQSGSGFSRFLNSLGLGIGSPAEFFSAAAFAGDISTIKKNYKDNGFDDLKIDTLLRIDANQKKIDIIINITEGYQSLIDSVTYQKIDSLEPKIKEEIISKSYLSNKIPFRINDIKGEIGRITLALSNKGYPNAFIENSSVTIGKVLSTSNYRISIPIQTGEKCYFGDTKIVIESEKERYISEDIIYKQFEFKTGDPYSIDKRLESERNINRLGIFDFARLEQKAPILKDSLYYIPINILLKPRDRYELAPEIFVNNQDNSFNFGAGLSGTVRNIGGGAQNLVGKISGSAQSLEHGTLQGSLDFSVQWIQPYFFSNKFSLNVSSSFNVDFRKEYKQNVLQTKLSVTSTFNKYNFFNTGIFDWELERAEVTFLQDTTQNNITQSSLDILEEPQFNSIFGITLQHDNTNDVFSPTKGDYLSVSLEESGFFPRLLIRNREKLRYAEYYKFTLFGKYFKPIFDDYGVLATKLKIGQAVQYGDDQTLFPIPLNRRFFAGGSSSLRGWFARGLGNVTNPELGGKLVIEGTLESRIRMSKTKSEGSLIDANKIWLVFFTDFGNIWNTVNEIHLRDVAISTGVGLRYDLFFGPLRIDFGLKAYDPYGEDNKKWITEKQFIKKVLDKGQIHFGIGHAF
jgi:outer membrane protein insertion porin family